MRPMPCFLVIWNERQCISGFCFWFCLETSIYACISSRLLGFAQNSNSKFCLLITDVSYAATCTEAPHMLQFTFFKMTLKSVAGEENSDLYATVYPGSFSVSLTILRRPLPRRSMYFMRWNRSAITGFRRIERIPETSPFQIGCFQKCKAVILFYRICCQGIKGLIGSL